MSTVRREFPRLDILCYGLCRHSFLIYVANKSKPWLPRCLHQNSWMMLPRNIVEHYRFWPAPKYIIIYLCTYIYRYIHILPCRIPTCHLIGKRLALARSTEGGELSPKVWISNMTQKRVDIKWYEWYQPRNDPMAPHQMSRSDDFGGGAMDQLDPTLVQQRCWSVVRFWNHSL